MKESIEEEAERIVRQALDGTWEGLRRKPSGGKPKPSKPLLAPSITQRVKHKRLLQ